MFFWSAVVCGFICFLVAVCAVWCSGPCCEEEERNRVRCWYICGGMLILTIILSYVGVWQRDNALRPWWTEINAAIVRSEQTACERAGFSQPHWTYVHQEATFKCVDGLGLVHEVMPPACNHHKFTYGGLDCGDEKDLHSFATTCGITLSPRK